MARRSQYLDIFSRQGSKAHKPGGAGPVAVAPGLVGKPSLPAY
jgi:hypothetical protein